MFAVALNYMGRDPNSKSVADHKAAADMMSAARPYVRKFHSSQYIDALANGDICLAIGYSGDILQAKDRAEEAGGKVKVAYAIPKEGTQIWFDVFALPKDAPSTGAAYYLPGLYDAAGRHRPRLELHQVRQRQFGFHEPGGGLGA